MQAYSPTPRFNSQGNQRPQSNIAPYNGKSNHSINIQKQIEEFVYCLQDVVGNGQFSTVYKGKNTKTGEIVAIKVIELQKITQPIFLTLLKNEIEILRSLNHKNLLALKSVYQTVNNIYLITEHCDQGDLKDIIQRKKQVPEFQAIRIMKHLINGLSFMQKHQQLEIIHRDIKPANILVASGVPKFADFGFAITFLLSKNQKDALEGFSVGTPLYMAPETLLKNQYTHQSDLWALGCVLYEMLFGKVPFFSTQHSVLVKKVRQYVEDQQLPLPKSHAISPVTISIIKQLLHPDPKSRINLQDLIKSSPFTDQDRHGTLPNENDITVSTKSEQSSQFVTCDIENHKLNNQPKVKNEDKEGYPSQYLGAQQRSVSPKPVQKITNRCHVPQSISCSTPFVSSKTINTVADVPKPAFGRYNISTITRPGVKIHPQTLKYDRGANHLCTFIERFTTLLVEDEFFKELEDYVKEKRCGQNQDILQLCDFKEKLLYITNKLQLAIQNQYGVQQDKIELLQQSLRAKNQSMELEMLKDSQFESVHKLEPILTLQLLRLYKQYLRLCILCFNKFLNLAIQNNEILPSQYIPIVRLDYVIVAYQVIDIFIQHFADFGGFCKISNIEQLTKVKVQEPVKMEQWQEIKKKIIHINLN